MRIFRIIKSFFQGIFSLVAASIYMFALGCYFLWEAFWLQWSNDPIRFQIYLVAFCWCWAIGLYCGWQSKAERLEALLTAKLKPSQQELDLRNIIRDEFNGMASTISTEVVEQLVNTEEDEATNS